MLKVLSYTILTILGLYMGYIYAETPGLDPKAAGVCLAIYCGALALDVVEFKKFMRERGYLNAD